MSKYQRGKIYKIVDNTNDNIYIGSTCEPTLARRLAKHISIYRAHLKQTQKSYVRSIDIIKNGNYNIVLLENYPCETKDELLARERHYIEALVCVNKLIPKQTRKEWSLTNSDRIKQVRAIYKIENRKTISSKNKEYFLKNKEAINKKRNIHISCVCGSVYYKCNKCHHVKCARHINFLNNIKNILKEGKRQLQIVNELLDEVQNIKPIKLKHL